MDLTPLIELTRGGTLECLHFGAVAVVNTQGQLVAQAGDPHWLTFSRSTLKALQALPFMQADGPRQFGFSQEQVALLCASHNGEAQHVEVVQGMLEQAGLTYQALRLPGAGHLHPARPGAAALTLRVELQEFSQLFETPQKSVGLLRLHATLTQASRSGETTLAQTSVIVQRPAATPDASGGVRALTAAADAAVQELDEWPDMNAGRCS